MQVFVEVGIIVDQVMYINVYVMLILVGDFNEYVVLKKVFGDCIDEILVFVMKVFIGYFFGGMGVLEVIFLFFVLCDCMVLLIINMIEFDFVVLFCLFGELMLLGDGLQYVISNFFGFGGYNVVLVVVGID